MNKRRTQFLSMGIPSMFVIFSVLCLVILALLTLGTSSQDLQAAQVSLKQTTDYCNACTQASAQYQNIVAAARDAACASSDKSDYLSRMKNLVKDFSDISLTWDSTNQTASFVLDYSDSQGLYVEFQLSWPAQDSSFSPQLLTWKTVTTGTWNPNNRQPVYKGEQS